MKKSPSQLILARRAIPPAEDAHADTEKEPKNDKIAGHDALFACMVSRISDDGDRQVSPCSRTNAVLAIVQYQHVFYLLMVG